MNQMPSWMKEQFEIARKTIEGWSNVKKEAAGINLKENGGNNMTKREAMLALLNGRKLCKKSWKEMKYLHWPDNSDYVIADNGRRVHFDCSDENGFEFYTEPTYTLQEVFDKGEGQMWWHWELSFLDDSPALNGHTSYFSIIDKKLAIFKIKPGDSRKVIVELTAFHEKYLTGWIYRGPIGGKS